MDALSPPSARTYIGVRRLHTVGQVSIAKVEPLTKARALRGPFDYRLPAEMEGLEVGSVVRVPFGRQRILGVVVERAERSELPAERLAEPIEALEAGAPPELVRSASGSPASTARPRRAGLAAGAAAGDRRRRPAGPLAGRAAGRDPSRGRAGAERWRAARGAPALGAGGACATAARCRRRAGGDRRRRPPGPAPARGAGADRDPQLAPAPRPRTRPAGGGGGRGPELLPSSAARSTDRRLARR